MIMYISGLHINTAFCVDWFPLISGWWFLLKIQMDIKTKQENALLLYQPGVEYQFLAATLSGGTLQVRFRFGDIEDSISVPSSESNNISR